MALPFDVANFNLVNFANAYNDLFDSTPKDVQVQLKDSNGNIVTKTVANRGKFKQQIWDDVGGALGQFNRTFYVDVENGDDNNDGSSGSPFKTIQKACDSVPVGGYGKIYLKTSNNIIDEDIRAINKTILINGNSVPDDGQPAIKNTCYIDDNGNATTGFILENSYLEFTNLTIQTVDFVDSSKDESDYAGFIKRNNTQSNNRIILAEASVLIGDTDFIRLSDRQSCSVQAYYYNYKHPQVSNGKSIKCNGTNRNGFFIYNEKGTLILDESDTVLGTKNDDSTALTWSDLVNGIVKDANNVPRNILSNIIF
jgi:hypothetical protein